MKKKLKSRHDNFDIPETRRKKFFDKVKINVNSQRGMI